MIVFNDQCRFEKPSGESRWIGEPHVGKIRLPGGGALNAGVVAMQDYREKTGAFFVMSPPSVWEAARLMSPGDLGLTAVFLHEFSHARQILALQPLFDAAIAKYTVPEYFNDDSLQQRFQNDPAYVAVHHNVLMFSVHGVEP